MHSVIADINGGTKVDHTPDEIAAIQAQWDKNAAAAKKVQYARSRSHHYPCIGDQLDMLWHSMDDGAIPGKGTTWFNTIKSIKCQFPKPVDQ